MLYYENSGFNFKVGSLGLSIYGLRHVGLALGYPVINDTVHLHLSDYLSMQPNICHGTNQKALSKA